MTPSQKGNMDHIKGSYVTHTSTTKKVKNLGWLLRHWKDVISFRLVLGQSSDLHLCAHLRGGVCYHTDYACLTVCWRWLDRPVFKDAKVVVIDVNKAGEFTIGDTKWREIKSKFDHIYSGIEFVQVIKEFKASLT